MVMNHMNLEGLKLFVEEVKQDLSKGKKSKKIECLWNFDEGKPQIESKIQHSRGETILHADFAPFMGGEGLAPDPIQYCLFGLAACFAGTFMSMATMMGIKIHELKVSAENSTDLSKTLGLTNNPIVEKAKIIATVRTDAKEEQLKELEKLTNERCPGVYCLVNPIRLETELLIK
ncbi:MAG: OsmC family protein [Thermodesulfobacteriota bacterium]